MIHPDIKLIGEDILKNVAVKVELITPEIEQLIQHMYKVMDDAQGIGLAANQIGSNLAIFVTKARGNKEVYINPAIVEQSEQILFVEGCLSVPGVKDQTKRYNKIVLTFQTPEDMSYTLQEEYTGLPAIVIQHEVDHLNGKLYIDDFNAFRKSSAIKKCNKVLKQLKRR